MNHNLVTILVPSYNHGEYLNERIKSIFLQTYRHFELIVIDDCSKDDSNEKIIDLQSLYNFKYLRNNRNSGTPFSSWEYLLKRANGNYIWICESDDVAEPEFLETAIERLAQNPKSVLFYSNSHVIDEHGSKIGNTSSYFEDIWREERWRKDFSADGIRELREFQVRGQIVPNMSSALIKTEAYKKAFDPYLKKFKLTGDWIFIGNVIKQGDVEFSTKTLNAFRKHDVTSRARVNSARSQAEFILTKYNLFVSSRMKKKRLAGIMESDYVRFLHEKASALDVVKSMLKISIFFTIVFAFEMFTSFLMERSAIISYMNHYKTARGLKNV